MICKMVYRWWHRGLHTQATTWGIVSQHGEGLAAIHLNWGQKILEFLCASWGRAWQYQSPCIWHVDSRLHVTAKWKQSVLGEMFERPARPLETYKARNDGNCRDHSCSQMACKIQMAIRCRCLLRQNGDNSHGCTPFHLETSVCQHASCTNTNE